MLVLSLPTSTDFLIKYIHSACTWVYRHILMPLPMDYCLCVWMGTAYVCWRLVPLCRSIKCHFYNHFHLQKSFFFTLCAANYILLQSKTQAHTYAYITGCRCRLSWPTPIWFGRLQLLGMLCMLRCSLMQTRPIIDYRFAKKRKKKMVYLQIIDSGTKHGRKRRQQRHQCVYSECHGWIWCWTKQCAVNAKKKSKSIWGMFGCVNRIFLKTSWWSVDLWAKRRNKIYGLSLMNTFFYRSSSSFQAVLNSVNRLDSIGTLPPQ